MQVLSPLPQRVPQSAQADKERSREGIQRPQKSEISGVRTRRRLVNAARFSNRSTLGPQARAIGTLICVVCVLCGVATRKNISIRDDQAEWVEENHLNLSSFVQEKLDELIEERS